MFTYSFTVRGPNYVPRCYRDFIAAFLVCLLKSILLNIDESKLVDYYLGGSLAILVHLINRVPMNFAR